MLKNPDSKEGRPGIVMLMKPLGTRGCVNTVLQAVFLRVFHIVAFLWSPKGELGPAWGCSSVLRLHCRQTC